MTPRFLIVDDHPIMRTGVRQLILGKWPEAQLAEAGSLAEAAAKAREPAWDALI